MASVLCCRADVMGNAEVRTFRQSHTFSPRGAETMLWHRAQLFPISITAGFRKSAAPIPSLAIIVRDERLFL